ncbi:MAG: hypothetical protein ABIQ95_03025 [Bdellovibrionia bacterium]
MWKHWVVRSCTPQEPFLEFGCARWTWTRLGKVFPEMVAAVLMPNHLHLILPKKEEDDTDFRKLSGLLGGISKRSKLRKLWQSIPAPADVPDKFHLRRQVRYVALNPCRKGLCADPLEWYWSTYREVIGASVERCESAVKLACVLGEPSKKFEVRFHGYVSADPSVRVAGTEFPTPAVSKIWSEESIGEILAASAGALRVPPADVKKQGSLRTLFIHLACRHGWRQPILLSRICGITPRAVHYVLNQPVPKGIEAAELCLGDRRLRREWPFSHF